MLKLLLWLSLLWAVGLLIIQLVRAWAGGRRDYSRPSGRPLRGVTYNFTQAMLPSHKETASCHWLEFYTGVALHVGVVAVAAATLLWLVWSPGGEAAFALTRPLAFLGLIAGVILLVRRSISWTLRAISTPDDYISIVATCLLLATAGFFAGTRAHAVFVLCAILVLLYLPLGKLRHAVFFYAARIDLGRRLGHRGVYPPAGIGAEQSHG